MFNFTKKKTIIGVVGLILSIVMAAVCGGFDGAGGIDRLTAGEKVIRIFCVSGMALALGFIMLILFDWKMFVLTFAGMEVMISMQFISAVNISVTMIFISVLAFGGCAFWFTAEYRDTKYKINGAVGARQQRKEREIMQEIEKFLAEDEELKRSIKYVEKSIVISSQLGSLFQVIKSEQEYYFHYVGSIFTKFDRSKLIADFENIEQYGHKKDYKISRADISGVKITLRNFAQFMDFGTLKIKNGNKTKSYGLINFMEESEVKAFFGEETEVVNKVKPEEVDEEVIGDSRKKVLNKINLARYIFSLIAAIIFDAYVFYNTQKTDPVFTGFAVAICLAPVITYFVLQDYLTIRDAGRFSKSETGKINIAATLIIFPVLFALKCILTSFSIAHYQLTKMLLFSLIPLAVTMIVFFIFCKEYKKFKSCIMVFAVAMIAFSPSFIYKVNSAFDFKQPDVVACKVIDLSTHTDNSGNVTYKLVFEYEGREIKTEIDESDYNGLTEGGEVNVLRYRGLFGIQTVYLE